MDHRFCTIARNRNFQVITSLEQAGRQRKRGQRELLQRKRGQRELLSRTALWPLKSRHGASAPKIFLFVLVVTTGMSDLAF